MAAPPNVLLVLTDQQRRDTVAALGAPQVRTPVLDRLAREGTAFTRAYTPSPVCVAARTALVTGLPPHQTGVVENAPAPPGLTSLMERLAALGYQTHGVGKMHFEPDPWRPWGFEGRDTSEEGAEGPDDYLATLGAEGFGWAAAPHGLRSESYYLPQPSPLPARLHPSAWVADRARDFLGRRDRDRPFFLWASFIHPHPPFALPHPWNRLYRVPDTEPPHRPDGVDDLVTFWNRLQNRYKYRGAGRDPLLERATRAAYRACVSFVDLQVGRILGALGGDLDDTLVVFTSDHGELLGDFGCVGKRSMHEASAGVPLLVRQPGRFAAGARVDTPVTLLDLTPTLTAAAGDPSRPSPEGADLAAVAGGAEADRVVFAQFSEGPLGLYLAADRRWKYVYSAADDRAWLFDLEAVDAAGGEVRDVGDAPEARPHRERLERALVDRFRRDGYTAPLDGDGWRRYPPTRLSERPDAGLLVQDPPGLAGDLAALGPYAPPPAPPAVDVLGDARRVARSGRVPDAPLGDG